MNLLNLVSTIFEPFTKLIDNVHTSTEEKETLKNQALALQNTITTQMIDYEKQLLESQSKIIVSEASSEHWIAANWRPIVALMLAFIVANNYIIYPYLSLFMDNAPLMDIPPDLWVLLNIMIGGYVTSRGIEKSVKEWKRK